MAGRIRMLQSPGVEITEIDKSQIAPSISGTYVLIPGFADKGEDFEIVTGNSIDQFVSYYGQPTNEAERYFYYATREVVQEGATAITIKLPYENEICNNYKALKLTLSDDPQSLKNSLPSNVTTCSALTAMQKAISTASTGNVFKDGQFDSYRELSAEQVQITNDAYDVLSQSMGLIDIPGNSSDSDQTLSTLEDLGSDWDLLLIDISKSILSFNNIDKEKDRTCEGMFVAVIDYASAAYAQRLTTINSDKPDEDVMDMVKYIQFPFKTSPFEYTSQGGEVAPTFSSYDIESARVGTALSDKFMYTSFSEDLMRKFPTIEITDINRNTDTVGGKQMASMDYINFVTIVVGRVKTDMTANSGVVVPEIIETHFGSLDEYSKDNHTGQSNYICNIVNSSSSYIRLFDNKTKTIFDPSDPLIAQKRVTTITYGKKLLGAESGKLAFPFFNSSMVSLTNNQNGETNNIDGKLKLFGFDPNYDVSKLLTTEGILLALDKAFASVSNIDEIQIDIVLDAGISNIAEFVSTQQY